MSEEKFITEGGNGPELRPVEQKDHSADPKLADEKWLREKAKIEEETTKGVVGPMACSPEIYKAVKEANTKKKAGRPKKKVEEPARKWRCGTCQEIFEDKHVMKIGAGDNRYAVFCPYCQKSLGFQDQTVLDTVADLIKNNPTGKNVPKA